MNIKSVGNEFKAFILKGNVVDLAVGVIIGAAFGKVVESVVKDLITPMIGMLARQPDFSKVIIGAHQAIGKDGKGAFDPSGIPIMEGGIMVGNFLNALIAFMILAAVVFFLVVKPMNALLALTKKKAEASPEEPAPLPDDVKLLMEIRDLLKSQSPGASAVPPRPLA